MKLESQNVIFSHHGRHIDAIIGSSDDVFAVGGDFLVGMHEIHIGVRRKACQDRVLSFDRQFVPSHVRDFQGSFWK